MSVLRQYRLLDCESVRGRSELFTSAWLHGRLCANKRERERQRRGKGRAGGERASECTSE
eukprot:231761-Alexandrium_andersonii.AAC.2